MLALRHIAAAAAHHVRGVAATVDEYNRLLVPLHTLFKLRQQQPRKHSVVAVVHFLAHIDDFHFGKLSFIHSFGEFEQLVLADCSLVIGFYRRGCAAEHQRAVVVLCPERRNLVGDVSRVGFGHITRIVLLVDDNQSDVFERSEHRASRAYRDLCPAAYQPAPLVKAFANRQSAVKKRDLVAETSAKRAQHLRRERDFGYKHYRGLTGFKRVTDTAHIHLGFAAAGHAVKKINAFFAVVDFSTTAA